jgi:hypothetical protein
VALTLSKEHEFHMFKNRVLRDTFASEKEKEVIT